MLCHRCGYSAEGAERNCPRDGLFLIEDEEHHKSPRDMFLGTRVGGRYPILGIVGRGGMGAVYRSVQPHVEREVAIKLVLATEGVASELMAQRFLREAKAIAKLNHASIVTLFDFGIEDDGTAYMVMELVRGQTLSHGLRKGGLARRRVVEIALEVLEALESAHGRGLIHRDLKPENIMLLDSAVGRSTLKVLDFGLAKLADGGSGGPQLTKTGAIFGTPHYMAPEQALAEEADARTDLYALGVILFEGLAGRLPFDSDKALALLHAHISSPIPDLPHDMPASVTAVIHKAMAKRPDDRFGSAAEMAAVLKATLRDFPDSAMEQTLAPDATPVVHAETAADVSGDLITEHSGPRPSPSPPDDSDAREPAVETPALPSAPISQARERTLVSLGDAAGEIGPTEEVGRRPVFALAAIAAVLVGVGLFGALGSDEEEPAPAAAAPQPATPVHSPTPAPDPTPEVAQTVVRITSRPAKARVYLGDSELGPTPLTLKPEGEPGDKVVYQLKAKGRKSRSLEIVLDGREQAHQVALVRRRARPARSATPSKPAATQPKPQPRPASAIAPRPTPRPTPSPASPQPRARPTPAPQAQPAQTAQPAQPVRKKLQLPRRSLK